MTPGDYTNRAALGTNVAGNWGGPFTSYLVNFCTQADFATLHSDFSAQIAINTQCDVDKKANTANLKLANDTITKSVSRLKEYIRDEFGTSADAQYIAYGLIKSSKGTYVFPTDNDHRQSSLAMLLGKLQTAGNPLKTKKQGLTYWQPIIASHAAEWATSKAIKSQKASASEACKVFYKQSGEWLGKLHKQISIDFPKDKVASTRRAFGFLNETYK